MVYHPVSPEFILDWLFFRQCFLPAIGNDGLQLVPYLLSKTNAKPPTPDNGIRQYKYIKDLDLSES
jgi:hypothetical protein